VTPAVDVHGLSKTRAWEHATRFGFGGVVTVATGVLGHHFGPVVGGMLLAFPAILPASLTMVKRHDGRTPAVDDARGARIGAFALAAFAIAAWLLVGAIGPFALVAALVAWTATAVLGWTVVYGRRRS
jgi:hypothetical protein